MGEGHPGRRVVLYQGRRRPVHPHPAARGLLDLERRSRTYWPEFARRARRRSRVAMLLDHQAGLPAVREPLPPGGLYDWEYMTRALAAEAPFWPPGTRQGYHAVTFGHLVGEMVRRVVGQAASTTSSARRSAGPLGLDFHIGLPEQDEPRVAADDPRRPAAGRRAAVARSSWRPSPTAQSIPALIVRNTGRRPGRPGLARGARGGAAQPGRHHQRPRAGRPVRRARPGREASGGVAWWTRRRSSGWARCTRPAPSDAVLLVGCAFRWAS